MKKRINKGHVLFAYMEPENETIYLRVPLEWHPSEQKWKGYVEIPNTEIEIHVQGKTDEEFQQSFVEEINRLVFLYPNTLEHIKSMCMPAWYWEEP